MSISSEKVKTWRKRTKDRVIESLGGKCVCCGYNKCMASLALHHINPNEKEDTLGHLMSDIRSWSKIIVEVRKCILLCQNCHGEVHAGVTNIPEGAPRFNEEFANYKLHDEEIDSCPVCKKEKPIYNITCSRSCAAKTTNKMDWDSINLVELLKTESENSLANLLNCSRDSIRKRLRKLGIK
jgi:hypothetical protein